MPNAKHLRPKVKCNGHTRTGQPCKKWAIHGGTVCPSHGGAAPRVKAKAAQRRVEEDMRRTLGRLQITPVGNPLTALAELAGEILAWKDLAAEKVAELRSLDTFNPATGEDVRATVVVFERALDRSVTVLGTIARLNIDERLARVTEAQAALVHQALAAALAEAGIGGEQRRKVVGGLERHLRVVPG